MRKSVIRNLHASDEEEIVIITENLKVQETVEESA